MAKITLYSEDGRSLEIEDTPRKRQWAKGKGCTLEQPPSEETADPDPESMKDHVVFGNPEE